MEHPVSHPPKRMINNKKTWLNFHELCLQTRTKNLTPPTSRITLLLEFCWRVLTGLVRFPFSIKHLRCSALPLSDTLYLPALKSVPQAHRSSFATPLLQVKNELQSSGFGTEALLVLQSLLKLARVSTLVSSSSPAFLRVLSAQSTFLGQSQFPMSNGFSQGKMSFHINGEFD